MSEELTSTEMKMVFIIGALFGLIIVIVILYILPVQPIHCYLNSLTIHGNLTIYGNHDGNKGTIKLSCP